MGAVQPRRAYRTLDGMRAIGALLVVMRHVPMFFGPIRVPESFLAVDLFYLVSGFVVAHAYGERLAAGASLWTFVKTRIIRLYPLYLFGLGLGLIAALIAVITDPAGWWTPMKVVEAVLTGLVLIPMFPGLGASGSALDGPVWTLLPELVVNFIYAALIKLMNVWFLLLIMAVAGAAVVYGELRFHTLDIGYNPTDQWAALARAGYSFFAGVLVFKLVRAGETASALVSWACVVILGLILAGQPGKDIMATYELGAVLVAFPLLLAVGSRFEPGPRVSAVFSYIGLMSYGIYIIHQPIGHLLQPLLKGRVHIPHDWRALAYGAVFLGGLIGIAGLLDKFYDGPIRAVLRKRFLSGKG
jgi:peptidoglycan/LPS O-acetylase OafA/YrhL